jgi:hypothetical protein
LVFVLAPSSSSESAKKQEIAASDKKLSSCIDTGTPKNNCTPDVAELVYPQPLVIRGKGGRRPFVKGYLSVLLDGLIDEGLAAVDAARGGGGCVSHGSALVALGLRVAGRFASVERVDLKLVPVCPFLLSFVFPVLAVRGCSSATTPQRRSGLAHLGQVPFFLDDCVWFCPEAEPSI